MDGLVEPTRAPTCATTGGGLGRRHFLIGAGAAGAAAAVGLGANPASAAGGPPGRPVSPVPKPIPGGIDSGDPRVGFIHWFLPGPDGSSTPVLGLPGFGLDVEPNTITDFKGFVAYAVVAGEAEASDGNTYPCEFDVRVMEGDYLAEDGSEHHAAFAFF